jgi:hypothetical protein
MQSHPARLPFWRTAWRAHASLITHAGAALRAVGPWLVLSVIVLTFMDWFLGTIRPERYSVWYSAAARLTPEFILLALGAFAAVKWHRLLLLGEEPVLATFGPLRTVAKYAVVGSIILLIPVLPLYAAIYGINYASEKMIGEMTTRPAAEAPPVSTQPRTASRTRAPAPDAAVPGTEAAPRELSAEASEEEPLFDWGELAGMVPGLVIGFVIILLLTYVPVRICLALPAVAIGRQQQPLADAWRLSDSNFWRLLGGISLPTVFTIVGAP